MFRGSLLGSPDGTVGRGAVASLPCGTTITLARGLNQILVALSFGLKEGGGILEPQLVI